MRYGTPRHRGGGRRRRSSPARAPADARSLPPHTHPRAQANDAFKASRYTLALRLYTEAIEQLDSEGLGSGADAARYHANRAFTNLKLENYGTAIADGERAIELDPSFPKGYYRKGAAYMALGRFREGRECFRTVAKLSPCLNGQRQSNARLWGSLVTAPPPPRAS